MIDVRRLSTMRFFETLSLFRDARCEADHTVACDAMEAAGFPATAEHRRNQVYEGPAANTPDDVWNAFALELAMADGHRHEGPSDFAEILWRDEAEIRWRKAMGLSRR